MTLPIVWRPEARQDWFRILDFISDRSPQGAVTLESLLNQSLDRICRFPHLYREGRVEGTREALFRPNYFYDYRGCAERVEILSVLHARRE